MPIYEYGCQTCSHEFTKMQKMSDAPLTECPKCGGTVKKLISNTSFVLKGGGWYSDGYASCDGKKSEAAGKKSADAPSCSASCAGSCTPAATADASPSSNKDAAA